MSPYPSPFGRSIAARSWQGILVATSLLMGLTGCQSLLLTTRLDPLENRAEKQEVALAAKVYQEVLETEPKSQNVQFTQMLDRVGHRIASAAKRPDFQWEFALLSGPRQDAFCLPGGKVVVYEGLMPICGTEAGLAVVLAHEVAHVLSAHGSERMAYKIQAAEGAPAFGRLVIGRDSKRIEMMKSVYGLGTQAESHLPFSRTQEEEADSIGVLLMARAGYDPQEAPRFWTRFQLASSSKTPDLLSKHPHDDIRTAKLNEIVPRAWTVYQNASLKHGLGERVPTPALVQHVAKPTNLAHATPEITAPVLTTPTATATPPTNIAAMTIAPAPVVQSEPAATPALADLAASLPNLGAPTIEGTFQPPVSAPIVTASFRNVAPSQSAAPASPTAVVPADEISAPASAANGGWKPHQE